MRALRRSHLETVAILCTALLAAAFLAATLVVPAQAHAVNYTYENAKSKVINAIELGGYEDNLRLAHAACTVSYSRRVWHGGGYDGTKLWQKIFYTMYPNSRWVRCCDINIATLVRWLGIDATYPSYGSGLLSYAIKSDKWDYLGYWDEDETKLLPGDILVYVGGTVNGKKVKGLHVLMYVGEDIVKQVYKAYVKGTDGDVGKPVSGTKYVAAHSGNGNPDNMRNGTGGSGAPCMDTAYTSYAIGIYHPGLYQVIRLKDAVSSEQSAKAIAARKTIKDGVYALSTTANSELRLGVRNASTKGGASAQLHASKPVASQRWCFTFTPDGYYRIINVASGKSLTVVGDEATENARVVQAGWKYAKSQKWLVVKKASGYAIRSALNKKFSLDLGNGKLKSSTAMRLCKTTKQTVLRWKLHKVRPAIDNGTYMITNKNSKRSLHTSLKADKPARQIKTNKADASQQWKLTYQKKKGYYVIKNVRSGLCLTSTANGVVQTAYSAKSMAQKWSIKHKGSAYVLRNAATGQVLSIANASKRQYAKAALVNKVTSTAQRWKLKSVPEASDASTSTGESLTAANVAASQP